MFNPVFDHLSNTSCFITNVSAAQEVDKLTPFPLSIVPVPVRTIHHTCEHTPQKRKQEKSQIAIVKIIAGTEYYPHSQSFQKYSQNQSVSDSSSISISFITYHTRQKFAWQ